MNTNDRARCHCKRQTLRPGGRGASRRAPGRSQPDRPTTRRSQDAEAASSPRNRLRILEEVESCTQPGEVGPSPRAGLYSSQTEWPGLVEGSLQGLTSSGSVPAGHDCAKAPLSQAKAGSAGEGSHRPYILDVRRTVTGLLGFSLEHGKDAMAVQPVDRRSAKRGRGEHWGSTGFLLPSSAAFPGIAAQSYARPGPVCVGTAHVLDVLASPRFVDRSPAEVVDDGSMKASICAPSARCTGSRLEPARESGAISAVIDLRCERLDGPQPDLVLGSRARGPNAGRPSSSMLARHLQPLRRGLDGMPIGRTPRSPRADRGNLSQASIEPQVLTLRTASSDASCTPNSSPTSGALCAPRRDASPKRVQDPEGSLGASKTLPPPRRCPRSPLVQHRADAGIAMLTPDAPSPAPDVQAGADVPSSRLGPSPRASPGTPPAPLPEAVSQPTRHFHCRRNESVTRNRRCLKVGRFRITNNFSLPASAPRRWQVELFFKGSSSRGSSSSTSRRTR